MSREIKFRAWLRVENDFNDKGYKMIDDLAFEEYLPVNDQLASVKHLMQYTGLKDKNGKEIYEGDICKTYNIDEPSKLVDTVVFDEGSFVFRSEYKLDASLRGFKTDYIEIIGNIFENPELIKQHL